MLALLLLALAQDPAFSGPQKGEKTPGFKVLDPSKNQEVDYIAEFNGAPTLLIFIHEVTRPAAQLFRRLDDHAASRMGLRSLIVLLSEDQNKTERYAPVLQGAAKLKGTIGVSIDGKEGPGSYGLNKEMTVTVILSKDNVVVGNWAIRSPNENDAPGIIKAIDELLGPMSLEERVAALEKEVRDLRALIERQQNRPAPQRPMTSGSAPKDPKLNELMRRLIRPERTPEQVDAVIKEIDEYVKDSEPLKKERLDGFTLLSELKYGTEYAQQKIKENLGGMKK